MNTGQQVTAVTQTRPVKKNNTITDTWIIETKEGHNNDGMT